MAASIPVARAGTTRPSATTTPEVQVRAKKDRAHSTYYWMVWPAVIAFAAFHTVPVITGIFYSFTNYPGYGEWNFVGLSNYLNLFKDDRILAAYGFSFLFAIVATILTNVISLAIALGLHAKIKARNFWRGVYFVPYVLSEVIAGVGSRGSCGGTSIRTLPGRRLPCGRAWAPRSSSRPSRMPATIA